MSSIELDGSVGEGGGQILRTALSLPMVTGTPFVIANIRAKRPKPGLLRQHLTAVHAAATVCGARVDGATLGSTALRFTPDVIRAGQHHFAIGSAGSCTLVLQTVLPALMLANASSEITLEGGTHNSMAPPYPFIADAFLPLLARMGVKVELALQRHGFYPAGGGRITARISPVEKLMPLTLNTRGELLDCRACAVVAGVAGHVARRELDVISAALVLTPEKLQLTTLPENEGPGNVVTITRQHAAVTEVFAAFGERGVSAEAVAKRVLNDVQAYAASDAAVGEHLADQLMLPMALAGRGEFTAIRASEHACTNAKVIEKFLPVDIKIAQLGKNAVTFSFES